MNARNLHKLELVLVKARDLDLSRSNTEVSLGASNSLEASALRTRYLSLSSRWIAAVSLFVASGAHAGDALVTNLLTKELIARPEHEISMLTVEYAPGGSSKPHRHEGQVLVYVLEGTLLMQIEGQEMRTLTRGDTFYESPEQLHLVSANASKTEPAKFLVVKVQTKGPTDPAPVGNNPK